MKTQRILILTIVSLLSALTFPIQATELTQATSKESAPPSWIEVGTVIGECYDHSGISWYLTGPKELKLYIMYLGEKLIYRVEWNGKTYPVVYHDGRCNASAQIPGWVYKYEKRDDGTSYKITDDAKVVFNVPSW